MAKVAKASKAPAKKSSVVEADGKIVYHDIIVTCACGAEFVSGSTQESIRVDICSRCHPFFTGDSRILDTEGRVEKFRKKYSLKK